MIKPRLAALAAFALTALAAGGASSPIADATTCDRSDAVPFYTTGTVVLATELGKLAAPCTDYYLSITPRADHGPRGGAPLTTIHALGSQFHAMADIHMADWQNDVASKYGGDWYAAGVAYRSMMASTGYNSGDTWAINEVGEPSNAQPFAGEVVKGTDDARQHLIEFAHGLHDGPAGSPPEPGLVFAADPLQVTTDLSQYAQDLRAWYADSAFWQGVSTYVRFWAQETYGDARSWGVPGSALSERAAYLNDYFMHGLRVATAGDGSTAAAKAFFASAYTPLGNASYHYSLPDTTSGVGFGYTDIGLPGMLNFVSSQTYALRSSTPAQFGFAVVPNTTLTTDTVTLEDRLAAAIHDSAADPIGACGQSGEWCDTDVPGAQFNDRWRALADATPPVIVPHVDGPLGSNGWYTGDVTVTWEVSDAESPVVSTSGCDATTISSDTDGTTLTCSAASYAGTASQSVTIKRDATAPTVSCEASPSILWPPSGKLMPVHVDVAVDDAMSGPDGFTLTAAVSSVGGAAEIVGFDVGTADVDGWLRATRPGKSDGLAYGLTYTGYDEAGNSSTACVTTVVVPHDLGR